MSSLIGLSSIERMNARSASRPAAMGDPFSCETLGIEMTGRVATARVRESEHPGVVIDHFHLLKVGEPWSIVSKLWDAEP
jgi:hypothetical protein